MDRVESMTALHPGSQLVITGGEPLEQNLVELVGSAKQNGMYVAVETNGIQAQELAVDWWAVSPKRERAYFIHSGLLGRVNEIKLVATPALTVDDILGFANMCPEYRSPGNRTCTPRERRPSLRFLSFLKELAASG
jgi:organic radical activating enzyme